MGESISMFTQASARGLARLGTFMANKGTCFGKSIMTEEAWEDSHSEPILKSWIDGNLVPNFTKSGLCAFNPIPETEKLPVNVYSVGKDAEATHRWTRKANENREGYFGWMGLGGSILQWNPEHNISFAYVPTDLMYLDHINFKGSII